MLIVGATFVTGSGVMYFLFMAAWLNVFMIVGQLRWITVAAGLIAVLLGIVNMRDWFRRGAPTLSIPQRAKPRLYGRVRDLLDAQHLPAVLLGTVTLAVAANAYELLCTAGFPMVFTRILTLSELPTSRYYFYLVLYNVVYVLPLLAIVIGFTLTMGSRKLKESEGRALKLLSGLMMLELGALLLLAPQMLDSALTALALVAFAATLTLALTSLRRWGKAAQQKAS